MHPFPRSAMLAGDTRIREKIFRLAFQEQPGDFQRRKDVTNIRAGERDGERRCSFYEGRYSLFEGRYGWASWAS